MSEGDAARTRRPVHVLPRRVPFGETDAAGVVFYPNYLHWFDLATHELFRSLGLPLKQLEKRDGFVLPVVSVGAEFKKALNYDDEVEIRSTIEEVSQRSLKVAHTIVRGEELVTTGWEVRGWAAMKDGAFRSAPIPEEIRKRLQ